MKRDLAILTAVLATVLGGCKKEAATTDDTEEAPGSARPAPEAPSSGPDTTTEDKPADAEIPEPSRPVVTLLEPGAEPRRVLRYSPDEGLEQLLESEMRMSMESTVDGTPAPSTVLPPMHMVMKIAVTGADDDVYQYSYELQKAEVGKAEGANPMVVSAMEKELAKTVGLRGTSRVDHRGMTLDATVDVPDGVPPRMKAMFKGLQRGVDQMSAPMPAEAVGVGARWKVEQVIDQNGIVMTQTATFTLDELESDTARLSIDLVQNAKPQEFRPSGMPVVGELLALEGKGSGKSTLDLGKLVPVESEVSVETAMELKVKMGAAPKTMSNVTKMNMTLKGR